MSLPFRRRSRPRFNGSPSDHAPTEQWLSQLRTGDVDGTTWPAEPGHVTFGGVSDISGLSDIGVMAIAIGPAGPAPLAIGPAPPAATDAACPACHRYICICGEPEPLPEWERDLLDEQARQMALPVLRDVPITMSAALGDYLHLPVVWCEMPGCISWGYDDTVSAGFADSRRSATDAGWRTDALGRLACTTCQQTRPDYDNPQPVTWHHPEVRRRWHAREHITEQDAFRLGVEAELGRRVSYENPALAHAIAGATHRTAGRR